MKWYETRYVSRRDWIIEHQQILKMTSAEFEMVMMIDFMNEHQLSITSEDLKQRTGMSDEETDHVLSSLCSKGYLTIAASAASVRFILDGLFDTNVEKQESILDSSLYDLFETEFGRPLSQHEMSKISEWNSSTDKQLIVYALREASIRSKLNMSYIDKIIVSWKKKGITAETAGRGNG